MGRSVMQSYSKQFLRQKYWAAMVASLFLSGCATTYQYADLKATGEVSHEAEDWGGGVAGPSSTMGFGGDAKYPGEVILFAEDKPILKQTIAANDEVYVVVDRSILGDCSIRLKVNGLIEGRAD